MRHPGGYACVWQPDGGMVECDTFTCSHCNSIVHVAPRASPDAFGSMCRGCMKMVCARCAGGACVPFLRKLDEMEARDRLRRAIGR
jgi:hypothetical protein